MFVPQPVAAQALITPPDKAVLLIEDDPDIRQLLENFLTEEGFVFVTAQDGDEATALIAAGEMIPEIILADYNLPGDANWLPVAQDLRDRLGEAIPVLIITGDISTATLRLVAAQNCVQTNKPMRLTALLETMGHLLAAARAVPAITVARGPMVYVVDDDVGIRDQMRALFELAGMQMTSLSDCESFLAALPLPPAQGCLLVDAALPGMSGMQLLQKLQHDQVQLPVFMVTGLGDIAMAVQAMRAGALDFLEKPTKADELLACVRRVLAKSRARGEGESAGLAK